MTTANPLILCFLPTGSRLESLITSCDEGDRVVGSATWNFFHAATGIPRPEGLHTCATLHMDPKDNILSRGRFDIRDMHKNMQLPVIFLFVTIDAIPRFLLLEIYQCLEI